MRIEKISLQNFKAFPSLELDLNGRDTVFFGFDGVGKSTVLSALAYLSQIWLRKLNQSQGKAFVPIDDSAITLGGTENAHCMRGLLLSRAI